MKKINKKQLKQLILAGKSTEEYDYSHITDMSHMFHSSSSLITIPMLDTSNVTDMSHMFHSCKSLITIPELDTSNVTDIYSMFANCTSLSSIPLLDTNKVTDMRNMFKNCKSLEHVFYHSDIDYNETNSEQLKINYPWYYASKKLSTDDLYTELVKHLNNNSLTIEVFNELYLKDPVKLMSYVEYIKVDGKLGKSIDILRKLI